MTIFSAALLLILVMDPFGNIPFFIALLQKVEPARRKRVVVRELLVALGALVLFFASGQHILRFLQISEPALTLAGGLILFLIAIRMIFPPPGHGREEEIEGEPFIVPLAIPYVAGPSALSTVMFIMNREPERWREWLVSLVLAWGVTAVLIFSSSYLGRFFGKRGLIAVERLMGMVLVTIAVQMLLNGMRQVLAGSP